MKWLILGAAVAVVAAGVGAAAWAKKQLKDNNLKASDLPGMAADAAKLAATAAYGKATGLVGAARGSRA